jgi:hypothetical protein
METEVSTRLSAAEGKKFATTVGAAFILFSLVSWARGHRTVAEALGCVGIALALAGLCIPTRLTPVWRAWMGAARAISTVTTPVAMGLIYFIGFVPIGLARRIAGRNSLIHRPGADGYWIRRDAKSMGQGDLERQF